MEKIERFVIQKGIAYRKEQPLAQYTTLKIGGKADYILFPNEDNIMDLLEMAKNEGVPFFVIGGGSNILVSDRGYRGLIIITKNMKRIKIEGNTITLGAGFSLGRLLAFMLKNKLSGMEGLVGIPGTVGGAVFGNAGSYGYEIKDCLKEIEIINENLELIKLKKESINFKYRSSDLPENIFIRYVSFEFKEDKGDTYEKMKQFLAQKRLTQPLRERSAGCVFKNPQGISAGYLIDKAGLKGTRIGDIAVSQIHANYFINLGNGRAEDFIRLMDIVRERVFKIFSIELTPEIRFLEA